MADPKADPTALLERWIDQIEAEDVVIVDPPSLAAARILASATHKGMRFLCRDYAVHRTLDRAGLLSEFGVEMPAERPEGIVVFLPKGKARIQMTVRAAASALADHAPLWFVGPKRGGIGSARTDLEEVASLESVDSGKHSKLLRSYVVAPQQPVPLSDLESHWTLEIGDRGMQVASYPGVFGHGRLDDGTRLLLETLRDVRTPLLDLGCGAGVIGAWFAAAGGEVVMADTDAFALRATRRTLALNHLYDVDVRPSDVFSDIDGRFADIVSNPPFHKGFETDHSITQRLVDGAPDRLLPGGRLTLVTNRFLPTAAQLERRFGGAEILAETGRFRVARAELSGRAVGGRS